MSCSRRKFLEKGAGAAFLSTLMPVTLLEACHPQASTREAAGIAGDSLLVAEDVPADIKIHISGVLAEVTDKQVFSTTGYNGQVPGPVIRLKEGKPVTVALTNDTDIPEFAHWHGQILPAAVDGAPEEMSFVVPPHGALRYRFTPGPPGSRWLHSHVMAGSDLCRGTYTGEFAFVYIEPKENPGDYDNEFFLTTHGWGPYFNHEEMPGLAGVKDEDDEAEKDDDESKKGWEVGYTALSINGKALGHGEPLRVREGQKILFHFLNANANDNTQLSLPGHQFKVIALDGNPVPNPRMVETLWLGVAERIDAVVEMNHPGIWILASPLDAFRNKGLGIIVEYAGRRGSPVWRRPRDLSWDYTRFGRDGGVPAPDQVIPMVFTKTNAAKNGFNLWSINGKPFDPKEDPQRLEKGKSYRLVFENRSDDWHPVHLHRNTFELTKVYDKSTSGVFKDVVLVKPDGKIEVDFTTNHPGLTLFHCHQQLHMDFGFMKLFDVV